MTTTDWYGRAYQNLGLGPLIWLQYQKARARLKQPTRPFVLRSKYAAHPLLCRPGTADMAVFHQIFVDREYRCLDGVTAARLIIDCGAYVGYSSAYLASAFPDAHLVAIEPDGGNYSLLCQNLAPYANRVETRNCAIWWQPGELTFEEETLSRGLEWGRTLKPAADTKAASIKAVDLPTLLAQSGFERISILKMDIEGAERGVFSQGNRDWLNKVDNIVIELHGPACESAFFDAIEGQGFSISTCEELTVCVRER